MDLMIRYNWPGNVRELMNAIERGVVLSRDEYLGDSDLSMIRGPETDTAADSQLLEDALTDMPLDAVEKVTILKMLQTTAGNKSEAARRLGITRKTLHKKLKKYGARP